MFDWLKRMAGVDPQGEKETAQKIDRLFRLDQGPADARYLRRLFPNSIFTKKFTAARRKRVREIMRRLRPEQKAIVRARGWNRGVEPWTKV